LPEPQIGLEKEGFALAAAHAHVALDGCAKLIHSDRLIDEVVHPGAKALLAAELRIKRGDGYYLGTLLPAAADVFGGLDTIHLWHLDIHEHQIARLIFQGPQDLLAICSQVCPVAG
jgi:hypothetical protein